MLTQPDHLAHRIDPLMQVKACRSGRAVREHVGEDQNRRWRTVERMQVADLQRAEVIVPLWSEAALRVREHQPVGLVHPAVGQPAQQSLEDQQWPVVHLVEQPFQLHDGGGFPMEVSDDVHEQPERVRQLLQRPHQRPDVVHGIGIARCREGTVQFPFQFGQIEISKLPILQGADLQQRIGDSLPILEGKLAFGHDSGYSGFEVAPVGNRRPILYVGCQRDLEQESSMRSPSDCGIGIVTALPVECAAMRTMIDQIGDVLARSGDPNRYVNGTMPSSVAGNPHRVVLTVMAQDNNKNAAAVCVDLLRSYPNVRCVLMVGIAGGIPTAERDVRLGDVVAATEGVVDYDHVRRVDGQDTLRRNLQGLSMTMARAAQEMRIGEHLGRRPWEEDLRAIPSHFARPPDETDLRHALELRDRGRMPRVHYAAIASADRLLRDKAYRDELVRRHPEVAAVEMEGSGIATATDLHEAHWFVVRGIADYCDNSKNAVWHKYASLTAAAYVRALLAHTPPLTGARPTAGGDRAAVVDLLMAIPVMNDGQTRQLIVERLRPEIRGSIRRFPAPRPDVHEIVSTCLDYRGGAGELGEAIRFAVGDSEPVQRAIEAIEGL